MFSQLNKFASSYKMKGEEDMKKELMLALILPHLFIFITWILCYRKAIKVFRLLQTECQIKINFY